MWKILNQFVSVNSRWVELIGENCTDENQNHLEYWRVEKDDSVIILPIQNEHILLPPPFYRHGIQEVTYDFPGGRNPPDKNPEETAMLILERELCVSSDAVESLKPLNEQGWPVNSSFSNQRLFGFLASVSESWQSPENIHVEKYPISSEGISLLLKKIVCLQCRAILLEWCIQKQADHFSEQVTEMLLPEQ